MRRLGERMAAAANGGAASNRYKMREHLLSFGDDFFIEDSHGSRIYKVDGKVLRARDTLIFENMQGQEQCKIQARIARVRDSMEIESPNGERMAMVHKAMITPLRERFTVKIGDGPDLEVQGNILDHEYRIGNVAEVSRKWFRVRDTYGVEVAPGQNDVLILAITTVVDQMANRE